MDALVIDPAKHCDEILKLRHQLQKLRWMGLDREAEQLACEIEMREQHSRGTTLSAPRTLNTLSCC